MPDELPVDPTTPSKARFARRGPADHEPAWADASLPGGGLPIVACVRRDHGEVPVAKGAVKSFSGMAFA